MNRIQKYQNKQTKTEIDYPKTKMTTHNKLQALPLSRLPSQPNQIAAIARKAANNASAVLINLLLILLINLNAHQTALAQCPMNTMTTFERVGGVTLKDTPMTLLYSVSNSSVSSMMGYRETVTRLPGVPITAECNNRCRKSARCRAFLVDYARQLCYSIDHMPGSSSHHQHQHQLSSASASSSAASAASQNGNHNQVILVGTHERTAYFEKHCFNLPSLDCERAWIFERVLGHQLIGHDDKLVEAVSSRIRCQELCMNEREFKCRSGEYDYETHQCRLSAIDRHTHPRLFRQAPGLNVDYFENQCINLGHQCDAFDKFDNMDLGRAEILRSANSSEQCQILCTQVIKAFICRSFTWNPETKKCYLNSANTFTVGGPDRLLPAPGLSYFQRNDCFDLQLECDHTAMTLNLRTNEPFRGRMYVRDDPMACETTGRSTLSSSLLIPFQSQARCAQRELVNRFSSVVVVQHHPLIQRRSDRYIKLVCDFQTANKTVTSTYNVMANSWTSTALINATSFAPKIRLRITDRLNNDVVGAKLGDELFLNIEAETDSVYDMVARSVMAKSGGTESESIMLIDKDGCPTDPRIFPSLNKVNRRTIRGKFDAFKFSTDVVVRFQVDVQFCLNACPESRCEQALNAASFLAASLSPNKADFTSGLDTYSLGSLPAQASNSLASSPASASTSNPTAPMGAAGGNEMMMSTVGLLGTPSPLEPFSGARPNMMMQQAQPSLNSSAHFTPGLNSRPTGPPSPSFNPQHDAASGPMRQLLQFPANQPANFSHQPAQDPLGDPQTFEARSANSQLNGNYLGNGQQENSFNSNSNINNQQHQHQQQTARRRRRRSAEPIPAVPSHVPLEGEIIIRDRDDTPPGSSSSSSPASKQQSRSQAQAQAKKQGKSSGSTRQRSMSGPSYDFSAPAEAASTTSSGSQQDQSSNFMCANKHSFVLAMLVFCAIQFLTIVLCLIAWLYRQNGASTCANKLRLPSSSQQKQHEHSYATHHNNNNNNNIRNGTKIRPSHLGQLNWNGIGTTSAHFGQSRFN